VRLLRRAQSRPIAATALLVVVLLSMMLSSFVVIRIAHGDTGNMTVQSLT
jgi:hypothetical protein